MVSAPDPLDLFSPAVRGWFRARFGSPTEVQRLAWERIAAGDHVLATAPTGSGKTLAAFLFALDRLFEERSSAGSLRVLYVSPLRALGNDVRRNLTGPLEEIRARIAAGGAEPPAAEVRVRTGDTPPEERARMRRRPPSILVTTPESLNILLTSRGGREMLATVRTLVLDEVHSVAGTKRGAHLITAVERLALLAGEFQRIALSATVRPLERIAAWVGGYQSLADGSFSPRPVAIVNSAEPKRYAVTVEWTPRDQSAAPEGADPDASWRPLVASLRGRFRANRSTLAFANSRRTVERLTRLLNTEAEEKGVYAHHGSLSREVRAIVEDRLKRGDLAGIVATNSLELGIDIGALDEVLLVGTPPSAASAAQRIGRAGHDVGEVSRARFYPLFPLDLLRSAVTARAVLDGEIEPLAPVEAPLDVLAQILVSMTAGHSWRIDDLYDAVRRAEPYRHLPRRQFVLVLEMLAGRYASTRVRELSPRVSIDRMDGTVRAVRGAERLVYLSGGTIPDRGYFHLRLAGSGALLGELDEEFVWERKIGDAFTLGAQTWRIERVTHNDVFVNRQAGGGALAPFWRAEERSASFEISERIGRFLEAVEPRIDDPSCRETLARDYVLSGEACESLLGLLREQRQATGGYLPHRHRLIVERIAGTTGASMAGMTFLHTLWGGRVNRPLALALAAAWEERHGAPIEVMHDDGGIAVRASFPVGGKEILELVRSETVEKHLASTLEGTGFFGARFREAAAVALLLPREGFRRRTPLWLSRQRAKELLQAVERFEDFPLRLEAWRACLRDEFDLDALRRVLEEAADGRIEVREVFSHQPSPFATQLVWKRTNELMYEDDAALPDGKAPPRRDLLREVAFSPHLRPRLSVHLVAAFERRIRRLEPGFTPRDAPELADWCVERVLIPMGEWLELLSAIESDRRVSKEELLASNAAKLAAVTLPGGTAPPFVAALECLSRVAAALGLDEGSLTLSSASLDGLPVPAGVPARTVAELPVPSDVDPLAELVADVLRFHGPMPLSSLVAQTGLAEERIGDALENLSDAERIVVDRLTEGSTEDEVCDARNLEALLRRTRARARPEFEPLPADRLPLFLACWQGLGIEHGDPATLESALEKLFGYAAPVGDWEGEILPARVRGYLPAWLDALFVETELTWFGCGEKRIAFAPAEAVSLFAAAEDGTESPSEIDVLPEGPGRFTLEAFCRTSGRPSAELSRRLWEIAWSGRITSDGFAVLRQGLATRFTPAETPPPRDRARARHGFARWRASRPFPGTWFRLELAAELDPLEREENDRERARVLLERYGVVFRDLLDAELPSLSWRRISRALRLMELSGEVVVGPFFADLPGPQFAPRRLLSWLSGGLDDGRVFWVQGADPASICGLPVLASALGLPRRSTTSHLVYHGSRCVVVSTRGGKDLVIRAQPDDASLSRYLDFLAVRVAPPGGTRRTIRVESINGQAAATSPYRQVLADRFHVVRDLGGLRLSGAP